MSESNLPPERLPRGRLLAVNIALAVVCTLPASAGSVSHVVTQRAMANSPIAAASSTTFVMNCNDSGAGSLREAFANATDDSIIDLTRLTCGTITLTTGEISDAFAASKVTIVGNGQTITRDATKDGARIIHHYGNGFLEIDGLTIENGEPKASNPYGGCIFSAGDLTLRNSTVTNCKAFSNGTINAYGGAIFTYGIVALVNSVVSRSTARSPQGYAHGGGIWSHGVDIVDSTISYNTTLGNDEHPGQGGGIFTSRVAVTPETEAIVNYSTITLNNADEGGGIACGNVALTNSAITFNNANSSGAGMIIGLNLGSGSQVRSYLYSDTISENYSAHVGGGLTIQAGSIVRMESATMFHNFAHIGAGTYANGSSANPIVLFLENTIDAGNVSVSGSDGADVAGKNVSFVGKDNIIIDSIVGLPANTIQLPPMLGPLQYNGGSTETLALLPGSPAINHGVDEGFTFDQRGEGYPRKDGVAVDIGAFEFEDFIFVDGFNPN
jgi:hypothetical protein